ncbi:TetR family transcriptional regulator [Lentzea atacamensis]|uniref:TetR family transcriptional regulator n=2 Tax=Lentzea TaxID=165301 RepID=A0A316HWG8_9PSEU|nr:TetR family transcriptional regulator [Lentzea atacamensis]PWK85004.1 TetR family transcriptional regulator [Lentzea atacamensis]RAS66013.1 TetR family transcriptional regulator [Lentzea atacamensis]
MSDEQRQRQRLDISRHAVRLFAEQGVAATSGEQIAQAAGVSERTFWRYFPHKESCVEPLLTKMVDAFCVVLRAWPPELELIDHLREAYTPVLDSASDEDVEAVLEVVRLTHGEPALRAAYLMLRERAEDALADVLAKRLDLPPTAIEVKVQAAAMSAVLKVATDDVAQASVEGVTQAGLDGHREQLATTLSLVLRCLSQAAAG